MPLPCVREQPIQDSSSPECDHPAFHILHYYNSTLPTLLSQGHEEMTQKISKPAQEVGSVGLDVNQMLQIPRIATPLLV